MPLLDIRICGARKLKNTQVFGKIDPFCKVTLEGKQYTTHTANNTTEPIWDEVFKFNVKDENSSRLHFAIWDKNVVSDDFLGEYFMSLSGLTRGEVLDKWVLLQNCKGNAELHVRVCAVDFGALPMKAAQPIQFQAAPPQRASYPVAPQQHQPQPQYAAAPPQTAYPPQQLYAAAPAYPPQAQGYQQQGYQQQGYQQQGYPPQPYLQPQAAGYPQPGHSPTHAFNPVPVGAL
jgi:hypothetical protein